MRQDFGQLPPIQYLNDDDDDGQQQRDVNATSHSRVVNERVDDRVLDNLSLYAELSVMSSHCLHDACLGNFAHCLHRLFKKKLLTDRLLNRGHSKFTVIQKISTYNQEWLVGGEALIGSVTIADQKKAIVISFHGSTRLSDWLNDFAIWQSQYVPISEKDLSGATGKLDQNLVKAKVHAGIWAIYLKLRQSVIEAIKRIIRSSDSITKYTSIRLTGHSLGGALSYFLMLDLAVLKIEYAEFQAVDLIDIYIYGTPKVGNKWFNLYAYSVLNQLKDTIAINRVVHANDLVPRLPPTQLGYLDYLDSRNGTFYWLDGNGTAHKCVHLQQSHTSSSINNAGVKQWDTLQMNRSSFDRLCRFHGWTRRGHSSYFTKQWLVKKECKKLK
ncbi:hypothetical protein MIR68_007947 [Amoeboaphelidium protococcarum]|nr:hypothetical protein MIR68_007947 [Amoeboaphelidium protococcarum]KAI3642927.1 hypothetical protein MP228_012482 [Amoeboaphelidium protococcarum]